MGVLLNLASIFVCQGIRWDPGFLAARQESVSPSRLPDSSFQIPERSTAAIPAGDAFKVEHSRPEPGSWRA